MEDPRDPTYQPHKTYYFMRYRWRRWFHNREGGRTYNDIGGWSEVQTVVDVHPVADILRKEDTYGERAWVERGSPFGPLGCMENTHEEYELLFFAEVPAEVGQTAMAREWGR